MNDTEIINKYFDLLEQTLFENNISDFPAQSYNCDETGIPLDHTPSSVVAVRRQKHPRVLACCNAAGYIIPPLVIFARKGLNPQLTYGEVPGTMYGLSEIGWMYSEIFENWFTHFF